MLLALYGVFLGLLATFLLLENHVFVCLFVFFFVLFFRIVVNKKTLT